MAKKKPSVRLKKYVAGVAKGKTKYQSALDAGYAKNTAANPQRIEKTDNYGKLLKMFEDKGIDSKWITKMIKAGGEAWKMHTSHTEPDIQVPDFDQRGKYLDRALRIMGITQTNQQDGNVKKRIVAEEFFND